MKFPKSARVRTRSEYLDFFKGSEVRRLGVVTLFRVQSRTGSPRVGMTVKARVNSVERNKIKRQIREVFRINRGRLGPFDYNVVVPGGVVVNHRTPGLIRKRLEEVWQNGPLF